MLYLLVTTHHALGLLHWQNLYYTCGCFKLCQLKGNATRTYLETQQDFFARSKNQAEALVSSVGLWTVTLFSLSVYSVNSESSLVPCLYIQQLTIYLLVVLLFVQVKGQLYHNIFPHTDNYTFSTKHYLLLVSALWQWYRPDYIIPGK